MKDREIMNSEASSNERDPQTEQNITKHGKAKMDHVKEEEAIMVRPFGKISPNSKVLWDKWAKNSRNGSPMMLIPPAP